MASWLDVLPPAANFGFCFAVAAANSCWDKAVIPAAALDLWIWAYFFSGRFSLLTLLLAFISLMDSDAWGPGFFAAGGDVMAAIRITWIIAKRDVTGGLGMDIY